MNGPAVSCVIPVFNGERFLADAIDSVLAQSGCDVEVIVVDDGSTDATADVVEAFGSRVRYVRQDNRGPSAALGAGIALATGDFFASLDADDLWVEGKLERQLGVFEARPELDLCVAHVQNFWEAEVAEEEARQSGHRRAKPIEGFTFGTLVARRAAVERVGPPDPDLLHGYAAEWFLRARTTGLTVDVLPDVLLRRRLHRGNRSRARAAQNRDAFLDLVKARMDERRETPSDPSPERGDR